MSEEKKSQLYEITDISLEIEPEKYRFTGDKTDHIGNKYTLTRNGQSYICPFKVQDWKNNSNLADTSGVAFKPTCNSHCPHFGIRADMDNIAADNTAMAQVKLTCGCVPVLYYIPIRVEKPKPDSGLKAV